MSRRHHSPDIYVARVLDAVEEQDVIDGILDQSVTDGHFVGVGRTGQRKFDVRRTMEAGGEVQDVGVLPDDAYTPLAEGRIVTQIPVI